MLTKNERDYILHLQNLNAELVEALNWTLNNLTEYAKRSPKYIKIEAIYDKARTNKGAA